MARSSSSTPPRGTKRKGGNPAKPTKLHLLEGGKPRPKEPVPSAQEFSKPDWLSEEAGAEWDRLAPDLKKQGLLTHWDVEPFSIYCEASIGRRDAYRTVRDQGTLVEGRNGMLVRNPAVQIWRDNAMLVLAASARFGFTPSDRAGMPEQSPADDTEALFSK